MKVGELIEELKKYPKDKDVKILAMSDIDLVDEQQIKEIGYPCDWFDEEFDDDGNPVFEENTDFVGIFTEEYVDFLFMNLP